jgi:peptidoglycan/xylan/chitin deacetylase (PgdA/CDA1 family)
MMHGFGRFGKIPIQMRIPRQPLLVICYHSVSHDWEHALSVTPAAFREQVASLARSGVPPVSAEALAAGERRGLHVTFDDAYKDVVHALPLLEDLGLPATIFASTAFADEGRPLAVPELAADAEAHPELLATMTWDELREAADSGVEIGGHTVSHPHLTRLTDAELDRELVDSKQRIEDELGRPARLLAYPYGEHDARVHDAVRRAGYAAAFAQWPGSSLRNPFALPRVSFYRGESLRRATVKTTFAGRALASARERLGR